MEGPLTLARVLASLLADVGADIAGNITERWVSAQLSTLARREFIRYVLSLLAKSGSAARFPGENYLTPNEGLHNIASLLQLAAELAIINPELAETITEGVSDDLMVALQHVSTEPLERWFTTIFGAENLDSDDVTEAYAWGLMPPEMMAWLLAVSGVSNSAAAAAMTKALGEKYSGNFRVVQDIGYRYGMKQLDLDIDWLDKSYSEARSALFGIPEAARTAYNDFISEVNRLYTQALRKAADALAMWRTSQSVEDAALQARYQARAELLLAEAEALLDVASSMSEIMNDYVQAMQDNLQSTIDTAVLVYNNVLSDYGQRLCELAGKVAELAKSLEDGLWDEYSRFADALSKIRGAGPALPETPGAGGGEPEQGTAQPNTYECQCIG